MDSLNNDVTIVFCQFGRSWFEPCFFHGSCPTTISVSHLFWFRPDLFLFGQSDARSLLSQLASRCVQSGDVSPQRCAWNGRIRTLQFGQHKHFTFKALHSWSITMEELETWCNEQVHSSDLACYECFSFYMERRRVFPRHHAGRSFQWWVSAVFSGVSDSSLNFSSCNSLRTW